MAAVDLQDPSVQGPETPPQPDESRQLQAHLAQARATLDALYADLRAVDAELETLAPPRSQHQLLAAACDALDELRAAGGAELLWGDAPSAASVADRIRRARERIDAFQAQVGAIEERRRAVLGQIARQQDQSALLEDDLFEALEQEERRRLEWIIEREINAVRARQAILPWSHRGEEDRRFRKSLGTALLVSLLLALIVRWVQLPVIAPAAQPPKIPQRVVALMMQMQPKPLPPPPVQRRPPPPPPKLVHEKPSERPVPRRTVARAIQPPQPAQKPAPKAGLLAYQQDLAAIKDIPVSAQLGRNARLRNAVNKATGIPERSMLTTNAPGSSGGIRLASLSRGLGPEGGAERNDIHGGATTRATSRLTSLGGGAHPLSHGPGPGRTDEEIQIVFDRNKASLYRLYNLALRNDPTLQGKMILRLTIEPDGSVSFCTLQSTNMNAPGLAAQVVARVKTFDFGAKAVPAVTIVYPIDFLPAT